MNSPYVARSVAQKQIAILHVPFTYFPDAAGGTEYYVAALIAALREYGISGAVAAPAQTTAEYEYDGVSVHRLAVSRSAGLAEAYGAPDEDFADSFRELLHRTRPDVVHLHAHTSAVSYRLAEHVRECGARLCFTYHTASVSCRRGTMMHMGREPCDGALATRRCSACTLQSRGMPGWLGNIVGAVPPAIGSALSHAGLSGRAATVLGMPQRIELAHLRFRQLVEAADCVIAVCQWAADVLLANGVSPAKLSVCRQGLLTTKAVQRSLRSSSGKDATLRLGYFGRVDPIKGVDTVIEAIRQIPQAKLTLDIYGICQPGSEAYLARLKRFADSRIRFHQPIGQAAIAEVMRHYDFVVIPSRCLETGPLVAYEAFAAGTPVLGSRLGGIAEVVTDATDGVLVPPDNVAAWSDALSELASDPARAARLREGVRPPRTIVDVAAEIAPLYRQVLH